MTVLILCSNHSCRGKPCSVKTPSSSKSLSSLPKRALSVSGGGVVSGMEEKSGGSSNLGKGSQQQMTLSSPPSPKKVVHASTLPFRTSPFCICYVVGDTTSDRSVSPIPSGCQTPPTKTKERSFSPFPLSITPEISGVTESEKNEFLLKVSIHLLCHLDRRE